MNRNSESGITVILVALGMTMLLGAVGLGVDMGYLRYERRLQQGGADAAAIAGASNLPFASPNAGATAAALTAASANGYTAASASTGCPPPTPTGAAGSVVVTVNNPPCSGPNQNSAFVEVYVGVVQPTFFMRVFGVTSKPVVTRAVATTVGGGKGSGCLYTLGAPSSKIEGITFSGGPTLTASTCGVIDDGDFCTNGAKLSVTAASIDVAGTNGGSGGSCSGGTVTPTPVTGIPPAGDPLSTLSPPPVGGSLGNLKIKSSSATVNPGTYSSISVTGAGGNVVFNPGIYVVTNGITITGNENVSGNGVMFYVSGGNVDIEGGGSVTLSAQTSGTYAGILIYQDPSDTQAAKVDGNSTSYFNGALYFPKAGLSFGGTSGATAFNTGASYTVLISDSLTVDGTADITLNSDYSKLPGGVSFIKNAVLVE